MVVAALSTALAVVAIVRLATGLGDDDPNAPSAPQASVTAALAAAQVEPAPGIGGNPYTAPLLADSIRATRTGRVRCPRGTVRMSVDWSGPPAETDTRDAALAQFKAVRFFAMADAFFKPVRVRTHVARYRALSPQGDVVGTVRLEDGPWHVTAVHGCR
jgi:hypothetical protein